MQLNPSKKQDLSQQTKKAIYEYIQQLDPNETTKLPREEILAKNLGVSRITIRDALNQLASEGVIIRKQGKGTFVNTEALQMKVTFSPIEDFRSVIEKSGYSVKVKVENISIRSASKEEAEQLSLPEETEIICIEKIFFADDVPAIYCFDRFQRSLYNGEITKKEMSVPLFQLIKDKMGKTIVWDKVELLTNTTEELPVLQKFFTSQKVKSFLNCNVVNYDENNESIVYSSEYIDTNIIRFHLIRQKNVF